MLRCVRAVCPRIRSQWIGGVEKVSDSKLSVSSNEANLKLYYTTRTLFFLEEKDLKVRATFESSLSVGLRDVYSSFVRHKIDGRKPLVSASFTLNRSFFTYKTDNPQRDCGPQLLRGETSSIGA